MIIIIMFRPVVIILVIYTTLCFMLQHDDFGYINNLLTYVGVS